MLDTQLAVYTAAPEMVMYTEYQLYILRSTWIWIIITKLHRILRQWYQLRIGKDVILYTGWTNLCFYQQYKNSFYPRTICDWNLLPSRLKDSATLDSFKNRLPVCYY